MNNSEKIAQLFKIVGNSVQVFTSQKIWFIKIVKSSGWLWIEEYASYWMVTLANGEKEHYPLAALGGGPAFMVEFLKSNGERKIGPGDLTGVWESALSMHPVYDKKRIDEIFKLIESKIDSAYHDHCAPALV